VSAVAFAVPGDELPLEQPGLDELLVALDAARDAGDAAAGRAVEAIREAGWRSALETARAVVLGEDERKAVCRVLREANDAKRLSPALRIFQARYCLVPVVVGDRRVTVAREELEQLAASLRTRPDGTAAADSLTSPGREVRLERAARTAVAGELRRRRAAGEPLGTLDELARVLGA
jgi:hypothetical protein